VTGELINSPITVGNDVLVTIISTLGGIIITYLTIKYKAQILKKAGRAPKDRMETIFDGYEKLIVQQQLEIDRKGGVISSLEAVVKRLEEELAHTRTLLNEARQDLSETREQNETFKQQLAAMRREYKKGAM
jgi:hypothetical protein